MTTPDDDHAEWDDVDFEDEDDEPIGSCDNCGCNIYCNDYCHDSLCDQCQWWIDQSKED